MLFPSRDNWGLHENCFKSSGWKKTIFSQQEKKKEHGSWIMRCLIWTGLICMKLLVGADKLSGCFVYSHVFRNLSFRQLLLWVSQWVIPLPKLWISDTSLWVRFSNISTDYFPKQSIACVMRNAACSSPIQFIEQTHCWHSVADLLEENQSYILLDVSSEKVKGSLTVACSVWEEKYT